MSIKAHFSPANSFSTTDNYLLPNYPECTFEESQQYEFERLKSRSDYVTITEQDIVEVRENTLNSLPFGDCVELLLIKQLAKYKGMTYWSNVKIVTEDNARDSLEKTLQETLDCSARSYRSNEIDQMDHTIEQADGEKERYLIIDDAIKIGNEFHYFYREIEM